MPFISLQRSQDADSRHFSAINFSAFDFPVANLPEFRLQTWVAREARVGSFGGFIETQKNKEKLSGAALKTPQIFQTTVLHIGTGLPWDFEVGPGLESERRQFDRLLQSLPDDAMVVADAALPAEQDFAACRDQRPDEVRRKATPRCGADVRPMAVRVAAKVLSGRKDLL